MKIAFRPKLLDCLPDYTRAQFGKDLAAGITVGALLAMTRKRPQGQMGDIFQRRGR